MESRRSASGRPPLRSAPAAAHPGQSEVHLHLGQPLPHAGPDADAERDEAEGVVPVEAGRGPAAVAAGRLHVQPALRDELLHVHELRLVVRGRVVAQVELSLQTKREGSLFYTGKRLEAWSSTSSQSSYLLGEQVVVHNRLIL